MQRWWRPFGWILLLVAGCAPASSQVTPTENIRLDGLHNLFRVSARLYSGSEPEGTVGFESLKSLGIRTVISVDAAEPDLAKAHAVGIKYIHLPVGYDGISEYRRLELIKAFQASDGPVYVHCHHGKHRGPAACSVLMLATTDWSARRARDWLRLAGTDERYRGLFGLPDHFRKPTEKELSEIPETFPEVAKIADLTKRMVDIDRHWSNIRQAKATHWSNTEAILLLVQDYREAQRLPDANGPMKQWFAEAEMTVTQLDEAVLKKEFSKAETLFEKASKQCLNCHRQERDNRSALR